MSLTNEQLEQFKSMKQDSDIPDEYICIGRIDEVYPTLPTELLENYYRTWIWKNDKDVRIATWDEGNTWLHFMCEGTAGSITKLYYSEV